MRVFRSLQISNYFLKYAIPHLTCTKLLQGRILYKWPKILSLKPLTSILSQWDGPMVLVRCFKLRIS